MAFPNRSQRSPCLFKCDVLVNYYKCMHRFPNPKKKPGLFAAWVSALGERLRGKDCGKVRTMICDNHFAPAQKVSRNRLIPGAVPVYLEFNYYKCMHQFPDPEKKPGLYAAWVKAIGERFQGNNLKYRRICDQHFAPSQKKSSKGLVSGAVPVYLDRFRQTLVTIVEVDHNYAIVIRGFSEPPQQADKGKGRAETVEQLQEGEPHSDHTYFATQKKTEKYGNRVAPVVNHPNPADTQIEPPTEIDLVPELPKETQKLRVVRRIPAYNVLDDDFTADDFTADDVPDHDPVPKVQDAAEKSLFSWQKTELIETDDPDEPPPRPRSPPADPTLAMYCDPDPDPTPTGDQAVPSQPAPAEKEVENRCKDCAEVNEGFEFWCVQCSGGALCGACAGRAPHRAHHVLRAPMGADRTQTQAVLVVIRQQLQNENLLSHETVDDGVKVEVKEEPAEAAAEAEPPEPDPLACEPPEPANQHRRIAEQIVDHKKQLKLPQLPGAHTLKENLTLGTKLKLVKVSAAEVKGAFLSQLGRIVTTQQHKGPQTMPQSCKENLATQPSEVREHQGTKTYQTTGNFTGITRQNQATTQASIQVTSEPQPSETVIIDLDEEQTIEYLEEGLDSDIETLEEVVLEDNETNEEDDELGDRETNEEDDELGDRETNEEDDELGDRETNEEDDELGDRETNEDNDGFDDCDDDDVLDEDYLVDADDFSEADESDEDRIESVARGVKRNVAAKQTLTMGGPSKSIIREDDLIEDDLSDEEPIVNVAGRGVKRKEDAEETTPARGPYDSMARAMPSKAVVRVRPLSSLEIRDWTGDKKRLRKY